MYSRIKNMPIPENAKAKLTRCVFVGPSLSGIELDRRLVRFGPALLGSIYLASKAGYKVIGLVDGLFGNVPTVWHKEILYALEHGCVVYGSSSVGALRAAELHGYGMQGIGLCYRLYRAGVVTDDDEVALLHGDAATNYSHFSEPLINARFTLRRLCRRGFLNHDQEVETAKQFKKIHFSERTFARYRRVLVSTFGTREGERICGLLQLHYWDVKREDAGLLVRHVLNSPSSGAAPGFFLRTSQWRHQFEELEGELRAFHERT
jgi:hypothetical protein